LGSVAPKISNVVQVMSCYIVEAVKPAPDGCKET
jgi:hypothetical protein